MKISRHYTTPNQSPYAEIAISPIKKRNPQPGRLDGLFPR